MCSVSLVITSLVSLGAAVAEFFFFWGVYGVGMAGVFCIGDDSVSGTR